MIQHGAGNVAQDIIAHSVNLNINHQTGEADMKKTPILIVTVFTLAITSVGYTSGTEKTEPEDSSSTMGMNEDVSGMMGSKQGGGMMSHHMKSSGVSPVTIIIQPGMMPMMGDGTMNQGEKSAHKGDGMDPKKMQKRHKMMKEHMERMEQKMENIEQLLRELLELQSQN